MKGKKQIAIERRAFAHLRVPLFIDFRFIGPWHHTKPNKIIRGKAYHVAKAGLCLETEIDMRDGSLKFIGTEGEEKLSVLPYLVSSEKKMRLEVHLPPGTRRFVIMGKAIWYELKSEGSTSKLEIGVLFTHMPREVRDEWIQYVKHLDFLLNL